MWEPGISAFLNTARAGCCDSSILEPGKLQACSLKTRSLVFSRKRGLGRWSHSSHPVELITAIRSDNVNRGSSARQHSASRACSYPSHPEIHRIRAPTAPRILREQGAGVGAKGLGESCPASGGGRPWKHYSCSLPHCWVLPADLETGRQHGPIPSYGPSVMSTLQSVKSVLTDHYPLASSVQLVSGLASGL